jgi:TetR/AcrR family transcriptional regulator, repressor for neighboring sulfatase
VPRPRVRRPPAESRRLILEAAEQLLVESGPAAVQVRSVAERVGMTDAGVAHHFGTRQDLLVALLRHGGRRLRHAVEQAIDAWADDDADIASLIQIIAGVYRQGYGALAVSLHAAGWRDPGGGMLEPVVRSLHAARERAGHAASIADTRLAVAALHQALALDPVYGAAFRRSASIGEAAADRPGPQLSWWTRALGLALGLGEDPSIQPSAGSSGPRRP